MSLWYKIFKILQILQKTTMGGGGGAGIYGEWVSYQNNLNRIELFNRLTLKLPDKLQPYGLYVYYVVHICDFGMLRVKQPSSISPRISQPVDDCVHILGHWGLWRLSVIPKLNRHHRVDGNVHLQSCEIHMKLSVIFLLKRESKFFLQVSGPLFKPDSIRLCAM